MHLGEKDRGENLVLDDIPPFLGSFHNDGDLRCCFVDLADWTIYRVSCLVF